MKKCLEKGKTCLTMNKTGYRLRLTGDLKSSPCPNFSTSSHLAGQHRKTGVSLSLSQNLDLSRMEEVFELDSALEILSLKIILVCI